MRAAEPALTAAAPQDNPTRTFGITAPVPLASISPERAASAVRGHEMEHVVREQAKARREGREVISQTVTIHTGICPECGSVYVSGGTTRTTTAKAAKEDQTQAKAGEPARGTAF